jgi:hypothetical protein
MLKWLRVARRLFPNLFKGALGTNCNCSLFILHLHRVFTVAKSISHLRPLFWYRFIKSSLLTKYLPICLVGRNQRITLLVRLLAWSAEIELILL